MLSTTHRDRCNKFWTDDERSSSSSSGYLPLFSRFDCPLSSLACPITQLKSHIGQNRMIPRYRSSATTV
jgi:Sec7-like guanine-nucleotide exchange factor